MTWQERIDNYARVTGFPPAFWWDGKVMHGMWVMGNDYRVKSAYYGGYPAGYLRRVKALFPDKSRALHLFSGKVDTAAYPGTTVNLNAANGADIVDDAHTLAKVKLNDYDIVLADPPYSVEDCEHYGTPMVNRNKVVEALTKLPAGAHLVWLDQVLPMYRKADWEVEARIGMVKSTMHRFRVVTIWRRL